MLEALLQYIEDEVNRYELDDIPCYEGPLTSNSEYVSVIKIDGQPLLPPVVCF